MDQTTGDVHVHVSNGFVETKNTDGIDESLYSRQLYVMGRDAQKRMSNANVLIIGMNGLGVEIAKNVILAGVKSVTLYDDKPTSLGDLSGQFYLTEDDVGTPRAQACAAKLAELNQYVPLSVHQGELSDEFIRQFRVVVMVDQTLTEAQRINLICHANSIAFILADVRGVFSSVFCDFGEEFIVSDKDGEQPVSCMVASITGTSPAVVTVTDEARHHLETGDAVTFREVEGIEMLNGCDPLPVKVTGPFSFTIGDLSPKCQYVQGGYVQQVKQPLTMHFKPLGEALAAPGEFLISDFGKMDRPAVLHQAFRALAKYQEAHGSLPKPGNRKDAEAFVLLCQEINEESKSKGEFFVENLEQNKPLLTKFAMGSSGVISPMCAFLGGVVGQETLKACSGKFTPINQFFYYDAEECLPAEPLDEDQYQPQNSRYDGQIAVFGKDMQEKINNRSLFLVGAGAIGCEMLKNWALMGIATAPKSQIHITDMDTIEKSNLNRQFLFRPKDVQQPKSTVAGQAAVAMNPQMKVQSYVERVGAETERVFNDDFYANLDGICTALDNVEARLYMDQRCLFYQLPMFESGTLGTKGNTQIVIPHKTENYGASRDPPEKSVPICTLKNFPNRIEHTLQWARDWFEGIFFQSPTDVNQYLGNSDYLASLDSQPNSKGEIIDRLHESLVSNKPLTFDQCIIWARNQFQHLFHNQIKQLLYNFPPDQLTTSGTPFWSGPKRAPNAIVFDANDPLHLSYIIGVANVRAENYGLVGRRDAAYFKNILEKIEVPEFVPRQGLKIAADDSELENKSGATADDNGDLANALPSPSSMAGYRLAPVEFEKDDDSHMEVIVATSNLRARNYRIEEADMHQSRLIAGKIIPAIATTTALVTGLVCLEMYKEIQQKPVEAYKNAFVSLALPLFTSSEPIPPAKTKSVLKGEDYHWSVWDRIDMDKGDITLKEFIAYFENEYELEISMISSGVSILYAMFSKPERIKERMPMRMSQLVETVTKKTLDPKEKYLVFELCASDMEGEEVELPYIRFRFRS